MKECITAQRSVWRRWWRAVSCKRYIRDDRSRLLIQNAPAAGVALAVVVHDEVGSAPVPHATPSVFEAATTRASALQARTGSGSSRRASASATQAGSVQTASTAAASTALCLVGNQCFCEMGWSGPRCQTDIHVHVNVMYTDPCAAQGRSLTGVGWAEHGRPSGAVRRPLRPVAVRRCHRLLLTASSSTACTPTKAAHVCSDKPVYQKGGSDGYVLFQPSEGSKWDVSCSGYMYTSCVASGFFRSNGNGGVCPDSPDGAGCAGKWQEWDASKWKNIPSLAVVPSPGPPPPPAGNIRLPSIPSGAMNIPAIGWVGVPGRASQANFRPI